jgi:hypothetical protein
MGRVYFLLDEGQLTYPNVDLWNSWFKGLKDGECYRVVIFCSYGSSSARALNYSNGTPDKLPPERRIQLWPSAETGVGLLLTREEFDLMVKSRVPRIHLTDELCDVLFSWTAGYAGIVDHFIDSIKNKVSYSYTVLMCD